MRAIILVLLALSISASAYPQDGSSPPSGGSPREGFAIGILATPALEGGGPWFMPAVRFSAPLGSKAGVDLDAGRVFGASNKYSEIRSFYAAQIRVRRAPRAGEGSARYWLAGLQYFNITKLDGRGTLIRHKPSGALSAGHGWGHAFQNGARILSEIGFAGGDGFMVYCRAGVQWGPPRPARDRIPQLDSRQ